MLGQNVSVIVYDLYFNSQRVYLIRKMWYDLRMNREIELRDAPTGLFLFQGILGFKSEYHTNCLTDAYVVESGEYFWGGTSKGTDREALLVTPVTYSIQN